MTTALSVAFIAIAIAVWLSFRQRRSSLTADERATLADVGQAIIAKVVQSGDAGVPLEALHAWLATRGIDGSLRSEILGGLVEGDSLAVINGKYVIGPKTMLVLFLGREGAKAALREMR